MTTHRKARLDDESHRLVMRALLLIGLLGEWACMPPPPDRTASVDSEARQAPQPAPVASSVEPVPSNAGFALDSAPVAAVLSVDGEVRGRTPLRLSDLAPGDHQIRLVAEGYNPWESRFHVTANTVVEFPRAELVPIGYVAPGRLDQAQVERVLDDGGYDDLERCHAATRGVLPVHVTLTINVMSGGAASLRELSAGSEVPAGFEDCVRNAVRKWAFPTAPRLTLARIAVDLGNEEQPKDADE